MANLKITILHVEDDEVDAMVVQRALKKTGFEYQLVQARNGLEALDLLRGTNGHEKLTKRPLVILLDLNMPQMNGHEFLSELRTDHELCMIPVYVLTTSSDENDILQAHRRNVAGYILKPVNLELYNEAIQTLFKYWSLIRMI
ncbi:MAG: response regulator [Bacteroidia bacterium]